VRSIVLVHIENCHTKIPAPPLPMFHINLHLPRMSASEVAVELSRHMREQFAARYRRAA
jgi:hypothetical protein